MANKLHAALKKWNKATPLAYFQYVVESYINGQKRQASDLALDLPKSKQDELMQYVKQTTRNQHLADLLTKTFAYQLEVRRAERAAREMDNSLECVDYDIPYELKEKVGELRHALSNDIEVA